MNLSPRVTDDSQIRHHSTLELFCPYITVVIDWFMLLAVSQAHWCWSPPGVPVVSDSTIFRCRW